MNTQVILKVGSLAVALGCAAQSLPNRFPFPNGSGILETYNAGGKAIDLTGPFFQSLGTNGRSCASCHRPAQGWSIAPDELRFRFEITQGRDPIFSTNDGSNCDHNIDVSTVEGRRRAYSLLLTRGLIRVGITAPANAEFIVSSVSNPYGCTDSSTLSMYRRPLPSSNLRFLSAIMWDGRESSPQTGTLKITSQSYPDALLSDLAHQVVDATAMHAQGTTPLTPAQQQQIVAFEMGLSTAQAIDYGAGALNSSGATGGPAAIDARTGPAFFIGINDPLGGNPRGLPFSPAIFNLFDAWRDSSPEHDDDRSDGGSFSASRRASILRGQALFNSKPISIVNVGGLNDDLNVAVIPGFCGTCHDSPNIGSHSVSAPLNIGVADVNSPLDVSYLPVFVLENKVTHEIKRTTDPGRALITGLWKDVGRLKGPILRGVAARAPYFHNGSARTLSDVIDFYNQRFNIGFTSAEKADLIAFLNSL